jgi:hypothetical protein
LWDTSRWTSARMRARGRADRPLVPLCARPRRSSRVIRDSASITCACRPVSRLYDRSSDSRPSAMAESPSGRVLMKLYDRSSETRPADSVMPVGTACRP